MGERLSALDVSFLYLEEPTTAMHVGSVMILRPGAGFTLERLLRHVEARIAFVPRYRQRVRWVPGHLANPVWVDDATFDIRHHVRSSALPRPGSDAQLQELVARLQARRLDRNRPLWELILVEGLSDGRVAVLTKVHQALVDGVHAVDLAHVVLDADPEVHDPPPHLWKAPPEPTAVELLAGAVADSVRRPQAVVETLRSGLGDVRATAGKVVTAVGGLAAAARTASRPTRSSPLNPDIGEYRRFATVATDLEDYRRIRNHQQGRPRRRRRLPAVSRSSSVTVPVESAGAAGPTGTGNSADLPGGPDRSRDLNGGAPSGAAAEGPSPAGPRGAPGSPGTTAAPGASGTPGAGPAASLTTSVNDVVLAVLAGALRMWLLTRGEPVPPEAVVRALVPVSVHPESGGEDGVVGGRVASLLVDLPTGEPSPLVRLHQIAYQTRVHREAGQAVAAPALAGIAGFAPPTLHSLGARVALGLSRRMFNVVITNVPGPQTPRYLLGARLLATYPVIPLARGQALSIGLTSYDGGVYYGLNGDRDTMSDLDVLGQCVRESLAEVLEAIR
jgi:hypothetical protein